MDMVENDMKSIFPPDINENPKPPILTQYTMPEWNLGNITPTVSINISVKLGVVKNIRLGQHCSLEEIKADMTLFQEF